MKKKLKNLIKYKMLLFLLFTSLTSNKCDGFCSRHIDHDLMTPKTTGNYILPDAYLNTNYSFIYGLSENFFCDGTSTKIWTGTNLPPGLALTSDGILSGVPTVSGIYNFIITVDVTISIYDSNTGGYTYEYNKFSETFWLTVN